MTNRDIFAIFKSRYPDIKVDDYRPLWIEFVKDKEGITIWVDNGDMIMYFPKSDMRGDIE